MEGELDTQQCSSSAQTTLLNGSPWQNPERAEPPYSLSLGVGLMAGFCRTCNHALYVTRVGLCVLFLFSQSVVSRELLVAILAASAFPLFFYLQSLRTRHVVFRRHESEPTEGMTPNPVYCCGEFSDEKNLKHRYFRAPVTVLQGEDGESMCIGTQAGDAFLACLALLTLAGGRRP